MPDSAVVRSPRLGFCLLIALIALFAGAKPILFDTLDPDCFWHLGVAAQLHRDGIGPLVDDLSFASSKQPWTPYSWLAELLMKRIWDIGGYRAAIATTALMQSTIVILLAATCRAAKKGSDPFLSGYFATVVATAVGTFFILPYLSFRPVTMGFVLLFAIAWLTARDLRTDQGGKKWVWCVVPLTLLLTNIHLFSFFVPGIFVALALGAMLESDAHRAVRYSLLASATALACLGTPMLPGLIKTICFYSAQDKMVSGPVIAEMQFFAHGPLGWIAGAAVVGMLGCITRKWRAVPVGQLICIAAATMLLIKLGRFAPLFALAASPAFAATIPALKDRLLTKPSIILVLGVVLTLSLARVLASFPSRAVTLSAWVNRHGPETPGYPCAAANFVDRAVPRRTGHLINEFSWGGYLAWRLDGKFQVLLDGRTQVYPQSLWQATYLGNNAEQQKFLAGVQADAALIPAGKSRFRDALIHLGWSRAFKDDRAEVLIPPGGVARID